ncbi:hypothetical protein Taro_022116 [Colocasia esculenta]|uniref:Uncharacterized protein n=1 Tax=Colocasia esculenta TaxID=4460 RepID=A0A843VDJ4_COLES|nr:hypothetical protein [Colocasia esculenta]
MGLMAYLTAQENLVCGLSELMDDLRMLPSDGAIPKPRKKKSITQTQSPSMVLTKGDMKEQDISQPSLKAQRASKRSLKAELFSPSQESDRSTPDSMPDPSMSNEYRALRRKYLLLEEESFLLDRELTEVDSEVKTLEDEKFALLDQLVVLEGLVDPSDIQPLGGLQ